MPHPHIYTEPLPKALRCLESQLCLIGLSGGKDSMFLTAALAEIQKYAPVPFDLACYTVDAMFSPAFPKAELEAFCGYYGLKHYSEKVCLAE